MGNNDIVAALNLEDVTQPEVLDHRMGVPVVKLDPALRDPSFPGVVEVARGNKGDSVAGCPQKAYRIGRSLVSVETAKS